MSREFIGMTRKPKRSHHSGNIQHPRGQKRPGKCGVTSEWCWLFSLTPVGWCITSTHHKTKTLTKNTTWKSFIAFVMLCSARDRTCGQRELGSCVMTTHQLIPCNWLILSWPNTTFLWFDRLPTLPTWPAIIGCSPTWKCSWEGIDLSHETTLYWTWWPSCTPFTKKHSRNALNTGGTAGRSVFSHKETTSKGIRVADFQACKCTFPGQTSDTLWTAYIHGRCCSGKDLLCMLLGRYDSVDVKILAM